MADERPPGPSPAYDPFRGAPTPPPSAPQQPQEQTPSQQPQQPQPPAPTRNPDGSWTVEVHPAPQHPGPSAAYPEPRKPMTAPTPIQAPAAGVQPPPAAATQQQPHYAMPGPQVFPSQPAPRRRGARLGLILGISIPVAMLAIGGIAAAIIVPGALVDGDAQSAADAYAQERGEWASVFSDAALQPLAELDTSGLDAGLVTISTGVGSGSYDDVLPDATAFQSSCDTIAGLGVQATMLSASPPALRVVDGGERNDAYAQAVAEATASQPRYEASTTFAADVSAPFDAVASGCALVLAQVEADAAFATAYDAWLATLTVPQGGTERFDASSVEYFTFTCNATTGCASFVDRAARAASGAAWDAAFVTYNQAMAQSYRDHCPTADVQAACDAWASMHDQSVQLASAVGAAYRDEDVTGGAVAGDAFPAPDLEAAFAAFVDGEEANVATAVSATNAATGVDTILAVVSDVVRSESQTIRDAAAAVRG